MIAAGFLAWFLAMDGSYSRLDGFILFACIISYTGYLIYSSIKTQTLGQTTAADDEFSAEINRTALPP